MSKNTRGKIVSVLSLGLFTALGYTACTPGFKNKSVALADMDQTSISTNGAATVGSASEIPGGTAAGTVVAPKLSSASVPTIDGIISRIRNGLEGRVNPLAGNFLVSLNVVKANMPKVSNPLQASGFDQAQLAIYGACSDLTTGGTPVMQSAYNVTLNASIATNRAALIAAGVKILDQHTAGLASTGASAADINKIFTDLVATSAATAGNTSRIAFMSVCIAANTTGVLLLGN